MQESLYILGISFLLLVAVMNRVKKTISGLLKKLIPWLTYSALYTFLEKTKKKKSSNGLNYFKMKIWVKFESKEFIKIFSFS